MSAGPARRDAPGSPHDLRSEAAWTSSKRSAPIWA